MWCTVQCTCSARVPLIQAETQSIDIIKINTISQKMHGPEQLIYSNSTCSGVSSAKAKVLQQHWSPHGLQVGIQIIDLFISC